MKGLIARTKGEIVAGGKEKEGRIEPTVVKNVDVKDALMEGYVQFCLDSLCLSNDCVPQHSYSTQLIR